MAVAHIEAGPPGREVWDALARRPTISLPFSALSTSVKLARGPGILVGWAVAENALGAGGFTLWDGDDNTGTRLGDVAWPAAGSAPEGPGVDGPLFKVGLFLVRNAGTLNGAVWVKI